MTRRPADPSSSGTPAGAGEVASVDGSGPDGASAGAAGAAGDPGRRRWIGLGFLAAGLSMIVLDGTIVGVALPAIIADLGMDLTSAQWVNSIYAVVFAALLLSFGRLGDRQGRRTVFGIGVVVFVVASVLAALAQGADALIAARALQGIGGAMVLPASLSTVNAIFRGRDRAAAFGVWGAVMAGMAAVGPLLGGWLTTTFDWRWIFIVNVPIGVVVVLGALRFVDNTRSHEPAGPGVDVDGLLTSALGFGLLVFGLIEGSALGWWRPIAPLQIGGWTWSADAPISAAPVAIALGVFFLVLFVLWERHRAHSGRSAILDLRLFALPTFSWGNLTAMSVAVGEFALVFVLPLYLVNVLGLSILGAGVVLAVMAAGAFMSGAMARHLAARIEPRGVVVLGLSLEVLGVAALVFVLGPATSPALFAACLAVYGVGLGLASAQLTSLVLADVPTDRSGSGSATQSTVRQVGSALGTAVSGSVLAARLGTDLAARLDEVAGVPAQVAQQLVRATTD
ncbi:EmrB/QacA subfamily drug resistance transporter [Kineosphaera limosa]|uniref:DHA2 family efflux MFS transporter permease subunit n=1 Tax=Kineosphaera limosa TaxID=111564 RepID=UPI0002F65A28|nr:DHA2 family efflux MFS transporter permease subunit [Kineosphaera limosa]NYE00735.1 EmrB/QacA subfamily drug resistance transporter [Kineosphaera limosa]